MHYSFKYPGQVFYRPTPRYYRDTSLKMEYPDHFEHGSHRGNIPSDVLGSFCREAARRNMKMGVFFFPCKNRPRGLVGHERVLVRDIDDRPGPIVCFRHPDFRAHWAGAVRDVFENYPITGSMFGSECGGPLFMFLRHGGSRMPYCWCEHCLAYARDHNIDPERARAGWRKLIDLFGDHRRGGVAAARSAMDVEKPPRPVDGFFISFLRVLSRYPEVLFWERMWYDHQFALQRAVFNIAKSINENLLIGQHMWHRGRAFSPLMRAAEDFAELSEISDFIRPALWANPAGMRFLEEAVTMNQTLLGDVGIEDAVKMLFRFNGYPEQGNVGELMDAPFRPDYTLAEVRTGKARLAGKALFFAGLSPGKFDHWTKHDPTPAEVKGHIHAAAKGGADGIMFPHATGSMAGVIGEGLREIGWVA